MINTSLKFNFLILFLCCSSSLNAAKVSELSTNSSLAPDGKTIDIFFSVIELQNNQFGGKGSMNKSKTYYKFDPAAASGK